MYFLGTFHPAGYHFQGPLSQAGYTLHIIVTDFVCLRTCKYLLYCSYFFECGNAWFSLEPGKRLQHFLLGRVAKFTSLCLEQGQGIELAEPPYTTNNICKSVTKIQDAFAVWVV